VVRISGPKADVAVQHLAGSLPEARRASYRILRSRDGAELDRALVLRFPGPASATGEDLAELHLHGGRAVVAAVLAELASVEGLRAAEPGEFTRRAFENGRIDLAEAEGLADLLAAETQSQRRAALALAGGGLSRQIEDWQGRVLGLAAGIEAALDFSDEGEVSEEMPKGWESGIASLTAEIGALLARPAAERLKDGLRVVIAGPPNAGKSSLLNALTGREAAITSAVAGTTRDLVEAPTAIGGVPFLLVDTAGLRESADAVEAIGVGRARESLERADLVLWLGAPGECPERERAIVVQSKADLGGAVDPGADVHISTVTGAGMDRLVFMLRQRAAALLPGEGEVAVNARHRAALGAALAALREAGMSNDMILAAESLRQARVELDRVTGRGGVENMLDALFERFCIGK
jgi:tRNA modification GTPase